MFRRHPFLIMSFDLRNSYEASGRKEIKGAKENNI